MISYCTYFARFYTELCVIKYLLTWLYLFIIKGVLFGQFGFFFITFWVETFLPHRQLARFHFLIFELSLIRLARYLSWRSNSDMFWEGNHLSSIYRFEWPLNDEGFSKVTRTNRTRWRLPFATAFPAIVFSCWKTGSLFQAFSWSGRSAENSARKNKKRAASALFSALRPD